MSDLLSLLADQSLAAVERVRLALTSGLLPDAMLDAFTGWCLQQAIAAVDPPAPAQPPHPDDFPAICHDLSQAVWRNAQTVPPPAGWTAAWRTLWVDGGPRVGLILGDAGSHNRILPEDPDVSIALMSADAAWLAAWSTAWLAGKKAIGQQSRTERPGAWAAAWAEAWSAAWDAQVARLISLLTP